MKLFTQETIANATVKIMKLMVVGYIALIAMTPAAATDLGLVLHGQSVHSSTLDDKGRQYQNDNYGLGVSYGNFEVGAFQNSYHKLSSYVAYNHKLKEWDNGLNLYVSLAFMNGYDKLPGYSELADDGVTMNNYAYSTKNGPVQIGTFNLLSHMTLGYNVSENFEIRLTTDAALALFAGQDAVFHTSAVWYFK